MTLRTKTLSAVSALLIGTAGFAFAQTATTEQPAVTEPASDENQTSGEAVADENIDAAEAEPTEADAEAEPADLDAETAAEGAQPEAPAEAETPEEAAADDTAADAAPAETVAGDEASEELQADQSADQSEAEEVAQDEATPAADDTAVETAASDQDAAAGDDAETAEEMVDAPETTVSEGETTAEADEAAEHAVEEEHAEAEGDHEGGGDHGAGHIEDISFSFEGPFGKYDQFQLQRGLQVYTEVCAACHGMKQVPIRTLADAGGPALPEDQVRAYAAELTQILDPETGEDRDRLPTDHFPTVTGMGMGPDLSLMAKARAGFHGPYGTGLSQLFNGIGGPEYIHAILVGYTGEDMEQAGTVLYENTAFAGGYIGMPAPLSDDLVTYEDGTPATVDQMARDVSAFLMWTAEPKMMARKQVGLVSVLFLIVLAGLLFYTNKRLWAPHKGKH